MSDEQKRELADDIKANGQLMLVHEALWKGEWVIIDGRSRLDARELNGDPFFDEKGEWLHPELVQKHWVREEQIPALVMALNYHRLYLGESQRAMAAAKLANLGPGVKPANVPVSITQSQAAKMFDVSERSVRTAKKVLREAPDQVPEIESGKKTVSQVASEIESEPEHIEPKPKRPMTVADIRACRAYARRHIKEVPDFARMLLEACDEVERLHAIADERHGAFSDFTLMPFGKHRGDRLADVPDDYLQWWLQQPGNDGSVIGTEAQFSQYPERAIAQQKLKLYDYAILRVATNKTGKDHE